MDPHSLHAIRSTRGNLSDLSRRRGLCKGSLVEGQGDERQPRRNQQRDEDYNPYDDLYDSDSDFDDEADEILVPREQLMEWERSLSTSGVSNEAAAGEREVVRRGREEGTGIMAASSSRVERYDDAERLLELQERLRGWERRLRAVNSARSEAGMRLVVPIWRGRVDDILAESSEGGEGVDNSMEG
ncbi:hypothetical protein HYFRA_00012494 [Hymenoscyphus fraxineus]|uniref:Uncharacterized protein n=1 Tax=Hymenoscyphus fraxineus TaxID=746836 RepID=A0A9N9L016_9HELO|nr:hypothetical protein HYFRA_00012494 [Hymenoscyphus fraxineus]